MSSYAGKAALDDEMDDQGNGVELTARVVELLGYPLNDLNNGNGTIWNTLVGVYTTVAWFFSRGRKWQNADARRTNDPWSFRESDATREDPDETVPERKLRNRRKFKTHGDANYPRVIEGHRSLVSVLRTSGEEILEFVVSTIMLSWCN